MDLDALRGAFAAVPSAALLITISALGAAIELFLFVASVRRLDRDVQATPPSTVPSRAFELIAALIPLAVATSYVVVLQRSRTLLWSAMTGPDDPTNPGGKATLISKALSGELNATALALFGVGIPLLLACLAVGVAVCARLRAQGLRHAATLPPEANDRAAWGRYPGPGATPLIMSLLAFVVLGLGPLADGVLRATTSKIHTFATLASIEEPDAKGEALSRGLDEARTLLEARLPFIHAGVAMATLIAMALAWIFSAARARSRLLAQPEPERPATTRNALLTTLGSVALAATALLVARPLLAENATPWPPYLGGERLLLRMTTPDLEGPDSLERAPLLMTTATGTFLDGSAADLATIEEKLQTLSSMYGVIHPGETFNRQLLVACEPDRHGAELAQLLAAAARASFDRPAFLFLHRQVTDRPLLGHFERTRATMVATTTLDGDTTANHGDEVIDVAAQSTCAQLCEKAVAARQQGHGVALRIVTQ